MIIFDLTRKETFVNLTKWIQTVHARASVENPPIIVIGNKFDKDQNIEVKSEDIEEFRSKNPLISVFEVSARSGFMVNDAFVELCIKMIDIKKSFSGVKLRANRISKPVTEIVSTSDTSNPRQKSRCCK